MPKKYPFSPDYAVPPGATLKELLEKKSLSQAELACRTGLTEKTVSQIINGGTPITHEVAAKFELALGVPARFWNNRELIYREALVKLDETRRLESAVEWLLEIPVNVLIDRSHIIRTSDKTDLVRQALKFFGVSDIDAWHKTWGEPCVQYRGGEAQQRRPGYVAAWLRLGELQAEAIQTKPFDAAALRRALAQIRKLTSEKIGVWAQEASRLCAEAGVAVVFTKEIEKAGVSGASRWLTKDKALIQLSLKYKTDDQLIFTFFHEVAHILLHGKMRIFVEFGMRRDTQEEEEANVFARDLLIPPEAAARLPHLKNRNQIREFAKMLGIAPGLVVGRLQYEELAYQSAFNDLKRKLAWN
jgi:transcriptional regulator with XRE-family HTH domain/Zn-dependent peptidase ImmA (M78 family)